MPVPPLALRQTDCGCAFGLINPPALTHDLPLVEERTRQYEAGLLQFCDCERGQRVQAFYAERSGNPYGQQLAADASKRRAAYLQRIDGLQADERAITLASFAVTRHNRQAIDAVAGALRDGCGLITLWGKYGVGKTGILIAAVNACRDQDRTAMYTTTADMLAWLRAGFDQAQRLAKQDVEDFTFDQRWKLLAEVRCLALDEITAYNVTPWAAERLERLIDSRWRSRRELLTICAFNAETADDMQTDLPGVIESRLRDRQAQWIPMGGVDMRRIRA